MAVAFATEAGPHSDALPAPSLCDLVPFTLSPVCTRELSFEARLQAVVERVSAGYILSEEEKELLREAARREA